MTEKIDPKYFEYEPEEVSDEETFETMAVCGMAPELIDDATEREAYIKFLEKRNAK